jgi:hypothetical protein
MDGKEYMARRRFYVPVNETDRYYGRQGDPKATDFLFEKDWEETDDGDGVRTEPE